VQAQFVLYAYRGYIIPCALDPSSLTQNFGDDKERDTRCTCFGTFGFGQHQVDDIFHTVMIAGGNKAFWP
jgi:hypothetical protein